jgi:DNA-binding PadR family transcriptional regulator
MAERRLTSFEHILLGLICNAPSSGYDLKRIFATSPMGIYQPSSGTLYPALRRLEQKGLVKAQAPSGQNGQSARHRRIYEPTQTGRAAHLNWLRTPVEPATVSYDLGLHLMRFVMMEHLLPPEEVLTFLQNLAETLAALTAQLEQYAATADFPGRYSRLALDHGIATHRASLRWAEQTVAALSADPRCAPAIDVRHSAAGLAPAEQIGAPEVHGDMHDGPLQ